MKLSSVLTEKDFKNSNIDIEELDGVFKQDELFQNFVKMIHRSTLDDFKYNALIGISIMFEIIIFRNQRYACVKTELKRFNENKTRFCPIYYVKNYISNYEYSVMNVREPYGTIFRSQLDSDNYDLELNSRYRTTISFFKNGKWTTEPMRLLSKLHIKIDGYIIDISFDDRYRTEIDEGSPKRISK